jgi:hypothetical protein
MKPVSFIGIRNRRGSVYLVSLTTLLVGTILALAMLRSGGADFYAEDSRSKKQAAVNLAEAGIDYAFHQIHFNNKKLPFSADVNMATGSFHVDAVDDGNRDPSTMLITSTGTSGKHKHTIKRVTLGLLPYHYALAEKDDIRDDGAIISNGTYGGIRANDEIELINLFTNVRTGAWAGGWIWSLGTVTPKHTGVPPLKFPAIDYNYYSSLANYYYPWDVVINVLDLPGGKAVIFAEHDVFIRGTYRGVYTIVAKGDIRISSNLLRTDAKSRLALITSKRIIVDWAASQVQAVIYAHDWDNDAELIVSGDTTFTDAVCVDRMTTDRSTTLNRDANLNLDVMRQLNLPGL